MNAPLDATVLHYQLVAAQAELANVKLERDDLAKALLLVLADNSLNSHNVTRARMLLDKIDAGKS